MTASLLGVLGALLGTIVGSGITFVSQRAMHRQEKAERGDALKRECSAAFLRSTHAVFDSVTAIYRTVEDGDERRKRLRDVSAVDAQGALDALRLAVNAETNRCAEALWRHLRDRGVPSGSLRPDYTVGAWKNDYRARRRELTNSVRAELGLPRIWPEETLARD